MSNPGLYSSIYQRIREYAALVDAVLISLKDKSSTISPAGDQLAQLFAELAQDNPKDLPTRIIALMLGNGNELDRAKWREISLSLRRTKVDRSLIITELEEFAHLLEQQQANALAKMRGWPL